MRIIARTFLTVIALMAVLVWSVTAKDDPNKGKQPAQSLNKGAAGTPIFTLLNINNFTNWVRYDGWGILSPASDNQSTYPRGTGNAIYTDGIYWGAKCFTNAAKTTSAPRQLVRVGGKGYAFGMRPGRVIGSGATAVAQNANDADVRIYRIRRDYAAMGTDELKRDAAEINEIPIVEVTDAQIAAVVAQYEKDWKEWPIAKGAPYIDRNKNGKYDAPPPFSATFTVDSLVAQNRDEPGMSGADPNSPADQVIWTVANDLDVAQTLQFNMSEPLGLEIQFTIWGYKRTDALGNLFFKRAKLINKGGVEIDAAKTKGSFYLDSVYVCNWSDIDLGDAYDDLAGCDSTLSLAFIYNANAIDATYRKFGLPPPATGYDFLAGPRVPAPGDSAVFDMKRVYGYKNLGMSSFAYFSAGSPYADPCNRETGGYLCNTGQWWKMLRGFAPLGTLVTADVPYERGPFPPSSFPLSGDPVTGKGFLDGLGTTYSFATGDRRILSSTGPFTLAPGDTQEVVVGVVAGLGADRLSSVAVMKFNDRFVQNTYDALFQVPRPPKSPNVSVAELNGQVILDWGSDLVRKKDIEEVVSQPGSYAFEGYNIYQLPARSSRLSEAKRVVTYDLPTDPTVVLDEQFDQNTGQILKLPVQYGSNSGLQRYFKFRKDYVRDIDKIYNGQDYYLVVTAYSVAGVPGYLPAALESTPIVLTVKPKVPFGKIYQSAHGDTLKYTHTGKSDGLIRPIVIDPAASNGNTYEVSFVTSAAGATTWKLVNKTKGTTILPAETNQSGDADYKFVEGGIFLKVEGPPPGMKSWSIPSGARRFSTSGAMSGLGLEGFSNVSDPEAYDATGDAGTMGMAGHFAFGGIGTNLKVTDYHSVLLKWAPVTAALWDPKVTPTHANYSKGYRYLRAAAAAAAKPEFVPWIINATSGYPYQDYNWSVPLSAWDVDVNPPVRLMVGNFENNVADGAVDGRYWPGNTSVDNAARREFLFIFAKPYSTTADPALSVNLSNNATTPLMWVLTVARRNDPPYSENDHFLIVASHVNTASDVFTYTPPAPTTGAEIEKASADKIGVFPNPYYAYNAAETNRFARFVTFNNLPPKATFRIFNLGGQLVRRMDKDDPLQFARWDLYSNAGFPVASGVYIVHIDMPDIGVTKVLKLAIIQEQEVLDSY